MKTKKVRLCFVDFWPGFTPHEHFLVKYLKERYEVEVVKDNPDFVFYSCFGLEHLHFKDYVKIYYTPENVFPNYNICDYSLSHVRHTIGGRNCYLPLALCFDEQIRHSTIVNKVLAHRLFCNFIL